MRKNFIFLFSALAIACMGDAHANWQYAKNTRPAQYNDDGGRFVFSVRGGMSLGRGKIKSEYGPLASRFYGFSDTQQYGDEIFPRVECGENCESSFYRPVGVVNLGDLKPTKNFSSMAAAAGASLGWTLPGMPQWRMELGWDHIAEMDYDTTPFAEGVVDLSGESYNAQSGGVQSNVSTDIISVMAFYDFFDGVRKPTRQVIPYVGAGVGYADIKTVLHLTDTYGDLSDVYEFLEYGERDSHGVIQFYKSEENTNTVAGLFALGMSYGLYDNMFLDLGARVMYVPEIKWSLSDESGSNHRTLFKAKNMLYTNIMLGVRFEF